MGKGVRSGNRPRAEYVEGIPRSPNPENTRQVSRRDKVPHIDLRVRRLVNVKATQELDPEYPHAWDEALNTMGRANPGLGQVIGLGSLGLTYIKSQEMIAMLSERYRRDFFDPRRKVGLFRRIGNEMVDFMRAEAHWQKQTTQLESECALNNISLSVQDEGYASVEEMIAALSGMEDDSMSRPETNGQIFGHYMAKVRGLTPVRGHDFGLDLTLNEQLYDERSSLVGHLAATGLPVHVIDAHWKPHLTVFQVLPHITPTTLKESYVPDRIVLDSPKPIRYPE